jgi:hypothetical protein
VKLQELIEIFTILVKNKKPPCSHETFEKELPDRFTRGEPPILITPPSQEELKIKYSKILKFKN